MKQYNVIYIDPPWRYEQRSLKGAAEKHYPTMSIEELSALPVGGLAAEDCLLFLWTTFPMLPEALRLIEAWGFKYKTVAFVWVKQNRKTPTWFLGLGFWTRGNAEICLLAKRGKIRRKSAHVHQLIVSPIEEHSKKPDETRDRIVELVGDVPRIELFARQKTEGWDVWGNEVPDSVDLPGMTISELQSAKEEHGRETDNQKAVLGQRKRGPGAEAEGGDGLSY